MNLSVTFFRCWHRMAFGLILPEYYCLRTLLFKTINSTRTYEVSMLLISSVRLRFSRPFGLFILLIRDSTSHFLEVLPLILPRARPPTAQWPPTTHIDMSRLDVISLSINSLPKIIRYSRIVLRLIEIVQDHIQKDLRAKSAREGFALLWDRVDSVPTQA